MFNTQVRHESKTKQNMKELSNGCSMYDPCPINFKCMAKASHLYVRCEECAVPFATHDHKIRSKMIQRENFAISVTNDTGKEFFEASKRCDQLGRE